MKRAGLILGVLLIVALLVWLFRPAPASGPVLPNPNGYDTLMRAGAQLTHAEEPLTYTNKQKLLEFVEANRAVLASVRTALTQECQVPVQFSQTYITNHLPALAGLKSLARLLKAEGKLAELEGHPTDAARSYLDGLRLSFAIRHGGWMIDQLVGIAGEAFAIQPLLELVPALDLTAARETLRELKLIEASDEPLERTVAAETEYFRHGPVTARIAMMIQRRSLSPIRADVNRIVAPKTQARAADRARTREALEERVKELEKR